MTAGHRTQLSATATAVRQAAEALDAFCARENVPEEIAWRLRVALDEIVANIVSYAAAGTARPLIEVIFARHQDDLEMTVADDGPAFDPLARPAPDITSSLEQRRPGGLGIALVKSLMDEVHYTRTTQNVLTMRKRIPATTGGNETT